MIVSIETIGGVEESERTDSLDIVDKLENLRAGLNNGRRNIPSVVDMYCPVCESRMYGEYIGNSRGLNGCFLVGYKCERCGDTQSARVFGDQTKYTEKDD